MWIDIFLSNALLQSIELTILVIAVTTKNLNILFFVLRFIIFVALKNNKKFTLNIIRYILIINYEQWRSERCNMN